MSTSDLTFKFSRLFIQIADENKFKRKQALESIEHEISKEKLCLEDNAMMVSKVVGSIFDISEGNRELACRILQTLIDNQDNISNVLSIIIPELVKRLGDKDVIEPSEEIRLSLIKVLLIIVHKADKYLLPFVPDVIQICVNLLGDTFADIKRLACDVVNKTSKLANHAFYANSDSLIKPLISNLCHQHSRVRSDVAGCIGNVLLYGAATSFDQVCPNMAQRLFDDNPNVRKTVVDVFGKWLLDLPDRYSFHYKLIPVFLSGYADNRDDIRELTADLWYDIGMKYLHENETELKEQIDFGNVALERYPAGFERPNLGCRVLMFRNLSKILPALTRDLTDWSENTRIKAAQLLPYLIINAEGACTQHCQLLIGSTLIRGLVDDEELVRQSCRESAKLLGYFMEPKVWWHILHNVINRTDADDKFIAGELILLTCIIETSCCNQLLSLSMNNDLAVIDDICGYLKSDDIAGSYSTRVKLAGLQCLMSIVSKFGGNFVESYELFGYKIFYAAISFASYETQDPNDQYAESLDEKLKSVLDGFSLSLSLTDHYSVYRLYMEKMMTELLEMAPNMTTHSIGRYLCCKFLLNSGPVLGQYVEQFISLLKITLNKEKEIELRLRFFITLMKLMSNMEITFNSQGNFKKENLEKLLDCAILPNLMWQSGRTAEAVRGIASTCLWSLLVGCCKSSKELNIKNPFAELSSSIWTELVVRQLSLTDDDQRETRLTSCKTLIVSFDIIHEYDLTNLNVISRDELHKMYPTFLKRMDDQFDDIRILTTDCLTSWIRILHDRFDKSLYSGHLEELNSGLLIHMDDSNQSVQCSVYEVMQKIGDICPEITIAAVKKVRTKHRSPKFCDDLLSALSVATNGF